MQDAGTTLTYGETIMTTKTVQKATAKTFHQKLLAALTAIHQIGVKKTGTNPMFKSSYATLGEILKVVQPKLLAEGLILRFDSKQDGELLTIVASITDGENDVNSMASSDIPSGNNRVQAVGSCLTYLRRYSVSMLLGLEGEVDDDGNAYQPKPKAVANSKPKALPNADDATGDENPWIDDVVMGGEAFINNIQRLVSEGNGADAILKRVRAKYRVSKANAEKIKELVVSFTAS